ncbi:MAG: zinc-ribbon domain-containing protein, partial [Acidimicrobiales bacterium]
MGTSSCSTCGASLPDRARFCPSCGAAASHALPVFDLGTEAHPDQAEPPPARDRTRITVAGVLLGAVALIVVLSVTGGGDADEQADPAADATTTTLPAASTTIEPTPRTNDDLTLLEEGARLDPAADMTLVWFRSNGAVVVADLGTGTEQVIEDDLPVRPVQGARWTGDSFLVRGVDSELYQLHPTSTGWRRVETDGYQTDLWWPGHGELLTLWSAESTPRPGSVLGRVLPDGELEVFDLDQPFDRPGGLVDGHLAVEIGGAVYLIPPGGTPQRHAFGSLFGASDRFLVRRSCNEVLECELVLDDVSTGTQTTLGGFESSASVIAATPAPDGSAVAVLAPVADGSAVELSVLPVEGGPPVTFALDGWSGDPNAAFTWTPDSNGLLWYDQNVQPSVQAVRWRGPDATDSP